MFGVFCCDSFETLKSILMLESVARRTNARRRYQFLKAEPLTKTLSASTTSAQVRELTRLYSKSSMPSASCPLVGDLVDSFHAPFLLSELFFCEEIVEKCSLSPVQTARKYEPTPCPSHSIFPIWILRVTNHLEPR